MHLKIVFLLCISAVLALNLRDTPEELQKFFKIVDDTVKSHHRSVKNHIRRNLIPLSHYVTQARNDLYKSLTHAAQPYWTIIQSLQNTAAEKGVDITDCINEGNNQIYLLNNTAVNEVNGWINYYNESGNTVIEDSSIEADSVLEELLALRQVVDLCNDDDCATELKKSITQFNVRANATLVDAETKPTNYVLDYLPVLLEVHSLDTDQYVANYTKFLHDITDCIGKNITLY